MWNAGDARCKLVTIVVTRRGVAKEAATRLEAGYAADGSSTYASMEDLAAATAGVGSSGSGDWIQDWDEGGRMFMKQRGGWRHSADAAAPPDAQGGAGAQRDGGG